MRRSTGVAVVIGVATALLLVLVGFVLGRRGGGGDVPAAAPFEREAVDEPATTPGTPALDLDPSGPAVDAAVAELQDYVAAARELPFAADVPVHVASDDEFVAIVDQVFEVPIADAVATGAFYEALGLIPPDSAELFAEELRARYRSILGFYDPGTDVLVVRGGDLDGGVRSVIVHELVHALDDQHFGLDRPEYAADRTSERETSFPMVTEGDATRIQNQWIDEQTPEVQAEARGHVGSNPSDLPVDFAEFVDFGFFAPYQAGTSFVAGLAATGGERLVDAVLVDPPETTEQVLFPEVFERRESRVRVPPPPADGRVVDQGVVGALFWLGLLGFEGSGVDPAAADAAVRGWGGDWQVVWVQGELTCRRMDVVGDAPDDTAELLAALTQWVATRPAVSVSDAGGRARVEVCYEVPPPPPDGPSRR